MNVIFYDGTEVEFEQGSNQYSMIKKVSSLGELDAIRALFTKCNVNGMKVDGESVMDVVPVGLTISLPSPDSNEIVAVFTTRAKTKEELTDELLEEHSEMLDFLTMNLM